MNEPKKKLFEITTQSTFENKYLIEASSQAEAEGKINHDDAGFFQKHLGEPVVKVKVVKKGNRSKAVRKIRKQGYW